MNDENRIQFSTFFQTICKYEVAIKGKLYFIFYEKLNVMLYELFISEKIGKLLSFESLTILLLNIFIS